MTTSLVSIVEEAEEEFRAALSELPYVSASELGLDRRCGHVWVSEMENVIISETSTRMLDYYGGFEYVKEEDGERFQFRDFTIYFGEYSGRVQRAIDIFLKKDEDED